ncbi:MAG TPA: hypothetical protein VK140_02405 [Ktedonobacteraceae bacterium]|nr:hypothetical protein [Ktedonobacteraceae bacterium]
MAMQSQYSDDQRGLPEKRLRLMIDITPELSRRIKMAATQNDLSVHEYVENMLEQTVPPETNLTRKRRGLNSEAVEALLRTSEEIMRTHPDVVFEDSAETLRQIREERTKQLEQL